MKYDEMLVQYVGDFGRFQKVQLILVCLPTIFTGMHSLSWTFTGASIPYRCSLSGENDNSPFIPISNNYSNWLYGGESREKIKHNCKRIVNNTTFNESRTYSEGINTEPCIGGYSWDTSQVSNSAVKKWEMVCDKHWLKSFMQSVYNVGQFFGSFIFGVLADKKKVLFISLIMQMSCGTAMAYVPYWPLFAMFRLLLGFFHPGIFVVAVVMVMEMVGPNRRLLSSTFAGIFFAFGVIFLGGLAYVIRDYQHLQLAISLPAVCLIMLWWVVPESARWLISQNRFEEADKILTKAAKLNKNSLPKDWHHLLQLDSSSNSDGRIYGYTDLFRTPNIRKRTLICCVCWPTVSMSFYGLAMNPSLLGGDPYLAFIIGGILEIVAIVIVLATMNVLGRKILGCVGFLLAAFCLFTTFAVTTAEYETLRMALVVIGKMCLKGVYSIVFVITSELYPTVIRTTAIGFCGTIAQFGSISAPYITFWLADIFPFAAVSIFVSFCLVAGSLFVFLPETAGQQQLETMDEAENFGMYFDRKMQVLL